jgi:hypothetical protein
MRVYSNHHKPNTRSAQRKTRRWRSDAPIKSPRLAAAKRLDVTIANIRARWGMNAIRWGAQ